MCLEEIDIHEGTRQNMFCFGRSFDVGHISEQTHAKCIFAIIEEIAKFQTIFINDLRVQCLCSDEQNVFWANHQSGFIQQGYEITEFN